MHAACSFTAYCSPLGTLKPQNVRPVYSNMVISTLGVDGWVVSFGTVRSLYLMQQPTHQWPMYQLLIIRCDTVIAFAV